MKRVIVRGRRWFQKSYGNTYFSATVEVDGLARHTHAAEVICKVVVSIPFEYGYGDHYMDVAADKLEELGYLPGREHYKNGSKEALSRYCKDRGIELDYYAVDVERKRDL